MNIVSNSVLNTIAGTGTDQVSVLHRKITIANDATNGTITPQFEYPSVFGAQALPSLVETVYSQTITWTNNGAANTTYHFVMTQQLAGWPINQGPGGAIGQPLEALIEYTTGSSTSNTDIGTSLALQVNRHTEFNLTATYSAGNSMTITATAGNGAPLFLTGNALNLTITDNMAGAAITASTAATPTVLTSAAHGLFVGSVITIVVTNPSGTFVSGTYRVAPTSYTAGQYTLTSLDEETVIGAAGATGTATVVKRAQYAVGQGSDLVAAGVAGASSGAIYKTYVFPYDANLQRPERPNPSVHALFVKEGASTTTAAYPTNFVAFDAELIEVLSLSDAALIPGATQAS